MKVHVTQEQMSEIQKKLFNIGLINAAKLVGGYKGLSKIFNGNLEPFYDNFAEKYGYDEKDSRLIDMIVPHQKGREAELMRKDLENNGGFKADNKITRLKF